MIQLQGEPLQAFLAFLEDAYPEIVAEPINGVLNISTDSMLFKAWEEFDEYCG